MMDFIDLRNIGVVTEKVDNTLLEEIKDEVKELEKDFSKGIPHNKSLAGNIYHEYTLTKCRDQVEQLAIKLAYAHEEKYRCLDLLGMRSIRGSHTKNNSKIDLRLSTLWANFQKKGEFNPTHTHNGIYSFVIWLQIPFFQEIEKQIGPGRRSPMNKAGSFEFVYTNILGDIIGEVIVLFPARLNHTVYPFFSSDEYRISVAGNLYIYE